MKYISSIIALSILLLAQLSTAQVINVDMGIGGQFLPSNIAAGETTLLEVRINNSSFVDAPTGSVNVVVDFPLNGHYVVDASSAITGPGAAMFSWTFNAPNTWFGVSLAPFPAITSISTFIEATGAIETPTQGTSTLLFVGVSGISDNNPVNDNATPSLVVPVLYGFIDASTRDQCSQVDLTWQTTVEINNEGWHVQRSYDGKDYENIAWIDGAGNSNETLRYEFVDYEVDKYQEVAYYRLHQMDLDGASEFSSVVRAPLDCTDDRHIAIYPNPANEIVTLSLGSASLGQTVDVVVIDYKGAKAYERTYTEITQLEEEIDVSTWLPGVYSVMVTTGNRQESLRMIKID